MVFHDCDSGQIAMPKYSKGIMKLEHYGYKTTIVVPLKNTCNITNKQKYLKIYLKH